MAMRRNQPKVQAKDLPVAGVTTSASLRPGEKTAMTSGITCGSMGTAMASARNPPREEVDRLVREMDTINLRVMVNLSGGTGEQLKNTVAAMKGRYPDRFVIFANMSYDDLNTPGFGKRVAARLEADVKNGAQGLKIFKNFGMDLKYANGERVHVDDPEFDAVFEKCAELKIPVLIHVA